jgi:hypothetical protein
MAKVVRVRMIRGGVPGAHHKAGQATGHGLVAMMKHAAPKDSRWEIDYDDGTTTEHTMGATSDVQGGIQLELPAGREH